MQEMRVQSLEDLLVKEMATHSSILAWKTPWTEEPGGLQSVGSQKKPQDLVAKQQQKDRTQPSWESLRVVSLLLEMVMH